MNGKRASKSFDYVIIGAGVAGLTLAHQLLQAGRSVLLIERHQRVGGLAKSFLYEIEGKTCIFDTGPKRFHTEDPQVRDFITQVLEGQYLEIGRQSSVYLFGRYFNWPLSTKDLFKLPLSVQLRVGYDLLRKLANGYMVILWPQLYYRSAAWVRDAPMSSRLAWQRHGLRK